MGFYGSNDPTNSVKALKVVKETWRDRWWPFYCKFHE